MHIMTDQTVIYLTETKNRLQWTLFANQKQQCIFLAAYNTIITADD